MRWVASRTKTETDALGQPLRMVGVIQDIDDLKKAEAELRVSAERLHHLSGQLLQAQETERRRIAHELHDEIGQSLTAAIIHMQMVEQKPEAAAFDADLSQAVALLNATLQQVRAMSLELRPPMLDDLGLVPALKWHLDRVGLRSGLRIQLTARGLPARLPADLETVCYRVVQESLTNIVRHAKATDVRVSVVRSGDDLQLTIRDNGVGFDVDAAQATARAGGSLGLLSMAERVTLVGGKLDLDSAPGQGCRISVYLPLKRAATSAALGEEGPDT
jgi:signal transduction histidine kinase